MCECMRQAGAEQRESGPQGFKQLVYEIYMKEITRLSRPYI